MERSCSMMLWARMEGRSKVPSLRRMGLRELEREVARGCDMCRAVRRAVETRAGVRFLPSRGLGHGVSGGRGRGKRRATGSLDLLEH